MRGDLRDEVLDVAIEANIWGAAFAAALQVEGAAANAMHYSVRLGEALPQQAHEHAQYAAARADMALRLYRIARNNDLSKEL